MKPPWPPHPEVTLPSTTALSSDRHARYVCLESELSALQDCHSCHFRLCHPWGARLDMYWVPHKHLWTRHVLPPAPGTAPPTPPMAPPTQGRLRPPDTHVNLAEDDVNDAADDNQEVEHIPRVPKIALGDGGGAG